MIRYKNLWLFLLISISAFGCATPKPIVRLRPTEPNTRFIAGREYVRISRDSLGITLGFDKVEGDFLLMDFEIANFSTQTVLVDPSKFYFTLVSSKSQKTIPIVFANGISIPRMPRP
jgi:hypothetical protein